MRSVEHTKSFELSVPVEELFPMFSPAGEKLWVPGWDYTNVMGTPELAEDYVFLTESDDHGTAEVIGVVKAFISGFTAAAYEAFIGEWQILLSRHFLTPRPLRSNQRYFLRRGLIASSCRRQH